MKCFVERVPELRKLEGWHTVPDTNLRIKISCRFKDILRCSDTPHFNSCFRLTFPEWWPKEKQTVEYSLVEVGVTTDQIKRATRTSTFAKLDVRKKKG